MKKQEEKGKKKPEPVSLPSLECSSQEYEDLLNIASSLSPTEAQNELLECARYGEVDSVRALIETWSPKWSVDQDKKSEGEERNNQPQQDFVNCADDSTALHKACANGHISTVKVLLYHGATYLQNKSGGNTPLHWACANGHEAIVKILLDHAEVTGTNIDVLLKNNFGRSSLTEGFTNGNSNVIELLLEHNSASEEKLMSSGSDTKFESQNKNTKNEENELDENSSKGITHEFDFLRDGNLSNDLSPDQTNREGKESRKTLLIRELPITNADDPFGEIAAQDSTGLGIWCASLVMARWVASKSTSGDFDGKTMLELGAGCAVPGLTAGLYSGSSSIYLTDLNEATMKNLQYNIDINSKRTCLNSSCQDSSLKRMKAMTIDWGDNKTWPSKTIDYIIGSDLIYQKSIVPLLKTVVTGLLADDGTFLYVCPADGRDGLKEFIASMKREDFDCVKEQVAPNIYRSNPLSNGDDEEAFIHFHELPTTEYVLYEFCKSKNKKDIKI